MSNLTVVINTKNEAENLGRCLHSLKSLQATVMVVDMGSTDETVAVAKKVGAEVLKYPEDHGFADPARNWAFQQVKTDWILVVDADEELTEELADFIKEAVVEPSADVYYFPRQNMIFGAWIKHSGWWPDFQPRLFRQGYLNWPGIVHGQPEVTGKIQFLPEKPQLALIHHNYSSISHFLQKLDRYTTLTAQSQRDDKVLAPASPAQAFDKFFGEFLRRYFAQQGIADGVHGSALSLLQASYELTTYLKIWEANGYPTTQVDDRSGVRRLRQLQRELNYWIADDQVRKTMGLRKLFWLIRRKLLI